MLRSLLKFVLLTRFSKALLAFIAFIFVYYVLAFSEFSAHNFYSARYLVVLFMIFLFVLSTLGGGIAILKSDRDFLFILPIPRRDLAVALYTAQLISMGLAVFFLLGYFYPFFPAAIRTSLLPLDIVAFSISITSLSIISFSLQFYRRLLLASFLSVWTASAMLGLRLSPAGIITGGEYLGSLSLVALAVTTTPLALKQLSSVELEFMRSLIRASSSDVKKQTDFAGLSPLRAIFSLNFFTVEFSGRMNTAGFGGGGYRSVRVRLVLLLPIMSLLAALYLVLMLKIGTFADVSFITAIASIYMIVFTLFMSLGVLGNERLWLGFTSVNPFAYLRYVVAARALSVASMFSPFAAADIVMSLLGVRGAINAALLVAVVLPCNFILVVLWSGYVSPVQIKEEGSMPSQFNLKQTLNVLPALVSIALASIVTVSLIFAVIISLVMLLSAFVTLTNKRVAEIIIRKMVDNGFV